MSAPAPTFSRAIRPLLARAIQVVAGMALVTASLSARALTFNFSFANTNGYPTTGGTASGTVTGLVDNSVNNLAQPGITANILSGVNVPPFAISSGTGTITVLNGAVTAYNFNFSAGNRVFFAYSGFARIADGNLGFPTYTDEYQGSANIFTSASPASAPAPLPVLGASAALAWSRRLRRRRYGSGVDA